MSFVDILVSWLVQLFDTLDRFIPRRVQTNLLTFEYQVIGQSRTCGKVLMVAMIWCGQLGVGGKIDNDWS